MCCGLVSALNVAVVRNGADRKAGSKILKSFIERKEEKKKIDA